jgi:hypothetical protein
MEPSGFSKAEMSDHHQASEPRSLFSMHATTLFLHRPVAKE